MPTQAHIYETLPPKRVSNNDMLLSAFRRAVPGDVIEIDAGNYDLGSATITASGKPGQPILIRSASGIGTASFRKTTLTIYGSWVYLEGILFDESALLLRNDGRGGGQCRITRCKFVNGDRGDGVIDLQDTSENRIDHCELVGIKHRGICLNPTNMENDDQASMSFRMVDNLIDHCWLHDFPYYDRNGHEPMNLGRGAQDSLIPLRTVVENNLFENVIGDEETISVKSSGNIIKGNTFKGNYTRDREGTIGLRHGNSNQVISNLLIDMGRISVRGDDHVVVGNELIRSQTAHKARCDIRVCSGNVYNSRGHWQNGNGKGKHPVACRASISLNTLAGDIEVGYSGGTGSSGGDPIRMPAEATRLYGNRFLGNGKIKRGREKNTETGLMHVKVDPIKELTEAHVGLYADDPLAESVRQRFKDNDVIGPGEFTWLVDVTPTTRRYEVIWAVDGIEVNRENAPPYGDRKNDHPEYKNWRHTSRYGAGEHRLSVSTPHNRKQHTVKVMMLNNPPALGT